MTFEGVTVFILFHTIQKGCLPSCLEGCCITCFFGRLKRYLFSISKCCLFCVFFFFFCGGRWGEGLGVLPFYFPHNTALAFKSTPKDLTQAPSARSCRSGQLPFSCPRKVLTLSGLLQRPLSLECYSSVGQLLTNLHSVGFSLNVTPSERTSLTTLAKV